MMRIYSQYIKICNDAVQNERLFIRFRANNTYHNVLESVPKEKGQEYASYIAKYYPYLLLYQDRFVTNDNIGKPTMHKFDEFEYQISCATCRYIKILGDLLYYFGDLSKLNIVEIGGGYGGQCKIIYNYCSPESYTIIDLHEPVKLTKKYLGRFGINKIIYKTPLDDIEGNYDLCISNYAFSEFDRKYQNLYAEKIINKSDMGYMICNFFGKNNMKDKPDRYTKEEIRNLKKEGKILKEIPLSAEGNFIYIYGMIDWIQGDKFRDMATFTYSPKVKSLKDDYDKLPNTFNISRLKDGDIIYTHMMYVASLLDIMQWFSKKFILISHSCDCSIEDYGICRPDGRGGVHDVFEFILPNNVIKWYSKNVNTINDRIESIPLGVENDMWHKKIPKLTIMEETMHRPRMITKLAYMNHNSKTNFAKREFLFKMFEKKEWMDIRRGVNGLHFQNYIDNVYNHKFVFSPEGNGMDTVRTWECLYMGTIPIEKRNLNNRFYADLPICFVDDWEQVTEDFLNKEYDRIKSMKWNMKKLRFEYWKNKILKTHENFIKNLGRIEEVAELQENY